MQGAVVTSALSFSSTATNVANALYAAAVQITSGRECLNFAVARTASSDGNTVFLDVSFLVDNTLPLTLLDVFNGEVFGTLFIEYAFISRISSIDLFTYPSIIRHKL